MNSEASSGRTKAGLAYAAMLGLTVLGFLGVQALGRDLTAPAPAGASRMASGPGPGAAHPLLHVLLALLIIVLASRLLGALFKRFAQPAVVGEIIAGITLGPSLLGRVAPRFAEVVLPPSVGPSLHIIAQVGVILFMFLVGVELDTSVLRRKAHSALAISHASIIAPFLLGAGTALWLYPKLSSRDVSFTLFALFMGVAMSITAFPVLARILTDKQMHKSKLGVLALSCAAVDDVSAWCLLAFLVSFASSQPGRAWITVGSTLGVTWR